MVMLILATDMARHSEILETFKAKIDKFDFGSEDHLNSVRQTAAARSEMSVKTSLFSARDSSLSAIIISFISGTWPIYT